MKNFITALVAIASSLQISQAAPLERRQYSPSSLATPFNIVIRPVELSGSTHYEEPLYLSQPPPSTGLPSSSFVALHGSTSTFNLKNGNLAVKTVDVDPTGTAIWQNVPIEQGKYVAFKQEAKAAKKGKIHVSIGGANALMTYGGDEFAWYFCSKADGTQLGLSAGPVTGKGVSCINVYAYVTPVDASL